MSLNEEQSTELEHLFAALTDSSSPEVSDLVLGRIVDRIPFGVHPFSVIESLSDPLARRQVRQRFGQALNYLKLREDWKSYLTGAEEPDLETGWLLVGRLDDDPEYDPGKVRAKLDELAAPLAERLADEAVETPFDRIETFRRYIFEELGFEGNQQEYYDPANSFLTSMLETKKGIPISLSVLCLLIASRVNLPLTGINFPGHFLVKFSEDDYTMFLDPFNGGDLITENDCFFYLIRQGLEPSRRHLVEASPLTILKRMYRNLINIYSSRSDSELKDELREHFAILENASLQS